MYQKQKAIPLFAPHRILLLIVTIAIIIAMAVNLRWDWIANYSDKIWLGLWRTTWLLALSVLFGFLLAMPIGLVQVTGPKPLAILAGSFCTIIRGTPLLLQLWLIYYGLGSIFPTIPSIRQSELWPYLRQAWPYALLTLSLSFAAYEAEVLRGAFASVPKGELEAARAIGMSRWQTFRRIWLPRAFYRALPTLGGEVILQLKATPLVATITMIDIFAVFSKVRQDTFITYEPLLLLALIYMVMATLIGIAFKYIERRRPVL
ncbi:MAG: ABC transporter permease [Oceanospirillaceae bacterium]